MTDTGEGRKSKQGHFDSKLDSKNQQVLFKRTKVANKTQNKLANWRKITNEDLSDFNADDDEFEQLNLTNTESSNIKSTPAISKTPTPNPNASDCSRHNILEDFNHTSGEKSHSII